jgi:signal transduction histidine kinase
MALPGVALPEARSLMERDYQELVDALQKENAALQTKAAGTRQDLTDYFTLWAHQVKTPISAMRLLLQSETERDASLEAELFKIEQYVEMVLQYLRLESDFTDFVFKEYDLTTWSARPCGNIQNCLLSRSSGWILRPPA